MAQLGWSGLAPTLDRLEFYLMHFMPYPDVVPGRPQGQWVDIPNTHFDPEKGHKLYKEYLDELVLGDELGYDALGRQRASLDIL